jgi:hypothetical protein
MQIVNRAGNKGLKQKAYHTLTTAQQFPDVNLMFSIPKCYSIYKNIRTTCQPITQQFIYTQQR